MEKTIKSIVDLVITLVIAVVAIPVWEIFLRDYILRWWSSLRSSKAWRAAFHPGDAYYVSKSPVESARGHELKTSWRDTDVFVEGELVALMPKKVNKLNDDPSIDLNHPAENLIVIGSPRYNMYADRLQRYFDMKQEYVIDSYDSDPAQEILKIVSEYGDEHGSSVDLKTNRPKPNVDYGLLLLAVAKNGKKICWISGIHGEGTIGVMQYLKDHPALLNEALSSKAGTGRSWLLRVEHERRPRQEPSFEIVKNVELVGDPHRCFPRSFERKPKALICDFGNVIMLFDRYQTYRAIGRAVGLPYETVKSRIEGDFPVSAATKPKLRDRYENGELTDHEFYEEVLALFPGAALAYDAFSEAWSDIFRPNRSMIEALRKLSQEVTLVLLSNTNNLHFSRVSEHYQDVLSMFGDRLVLSYREKVSKPSEEIFRRAIQKAGPHVVAADCVFVDDRTGYVKTATRLGMRGLVYYSHPQFVFWLRRHGLYVPQLVDQGNSESPLEE